MKHKLPTPLYIDCSGLSTKRAKLLSDRLKACFAKVEVWDDEIVASKPLSGGHYDSAWNILDRYGVKVTF
ncbi:MAG: hypothetical protein IJQ82_15635 [Selenomonadaceae bacterium]|nr:hypothetical protein [Selenomonadaceae bacterium]